MVLVSLQNPNMFIVHTCMCTTHGYVTCDTDLDMGKKCCRHSLLVPAFRLPPLLAAGAQEGQEVPLDRFGCRKCLRMAKPVSHSASK